MAVKRPALWFAILFLLLAACTTAELETGEIVGGVFCDRNRDADCSCEEGFADIRIHLHSGDCGGPILQSVLSGEDGSFQFSALPPGPYCVFADVRPLCGGEAGYDLTTGISRVIEVRAGWIHELVWFGLSPILQSTPVP